MGLSLKIFLSILLTTSLAGVGFFFLLDPSGGDALWGYLMLGTDALLAVGLGTLIPRSIQQIAKQTETLSAQLTETGIAALSQPSEPFTEVESLSGEAQTIAEFLQNTQISAQTILEQYNELQQTATERIDTLNNEVLDLKRRATQKIRSMRDETETIKSDAQGQQSALQAILDETSDGLNEARDTCRQVREEELIPALNKIEALENELEQCQLDAEEKQLHMQQALKLAQEGTSKTTKQYQSEIHTLQQRIQSISNDLSDSQEALISAKNDAKSTISERDEALNTLKSRHEALETELSDSQQNSEKLSEQNSELSEQQSQLAKQRDDLTNQLESTTEQLDNLKNQLDHAQQTLTDHQETTTQSAEEANSRIQDLSQQVSDLQSAIEHARSKVDAAEQRALEAGLAVTRSEQNIAREREAARQWAGQAHEQSNQLQQLHSQLNALSSEKTALEAEKATLDDTYDTLKTNYDRLEAELADLQQNSLSENQQQTRLIRDLSSKQTALNALANQLKRERQHLKVACESAESRLRIVQSDTASNDALSYGLKETVAKQSQQILDQARAVENLASELEQSRKRHRSQLQIHAENAHNVQEKLSESDVALDTYRNQLKDLKWALVSEQAKRIAMERQLAKCSDLNQIDQAEPSVLQQPIVLPESKAEPTCDTQETASLSEPTEVFTESTAASVSTSTEEDDTTDNSRRIRIMAERLRLSTQLVKTLITNLTEGALTLDATGHITALNPKAERILGWTSEEVMGQNAMDRICMEQINENTGETLVSCPVRQMLTDRKMHRSAAMRLLDRAGHPYPINVTAIPLPNGGGLVLFSEVETSIQKGVSRLNDRFPPTPLNSLLWETGLSEKQRLKLNDSVNRNAHELILTVRNLESFAELQKKSIQFRNWQFNPLELINSVITLFKPLADDKNLSLKAQGEHDLPSLVIGDPIRLQWVLINLLDNALRESQKGKIILLAQMEGNTNEDQDLRLSVKDSGPGLPKAWNQDVFDPNNLPKACKGKERPGIGLLVCVKTVRSLGGVMGSVKKRKGKGTEVWLTIPAKQPEVPANSVIDAKSTFQFQTNALLVHSQQMENPQDTNTALVSLKRQSLDLPGTV
ncbi:MAG: PAS domain-containing protein [Magnetococcales bacterium]|nr:PAS domain-containing protein [Magnetococcales bacterium]